MQSSKFLVLSVLIFGFIIVLGLATLRITRGQVGGLSVITLTILLPLIIWTIYGYKENTLDNLRLWFINTPKKRGILFFSIIFWYIGIVSILSYYLYDNLITNITFVLTIGFLLGYFSYRALLRLL